MAHSKLTLESAHSKCQPFAPSESHSIYFPANQPEDLKKMISSRVRALTGTICSLVITVSLAIPNSLAQDGNGHQRSIRGFSQADARTEHDWEAKMKAIPKPENLREYMKHLSAEPHHVGSAYDKQNAEYIRDKFKSWGIDARLEEFDVLFPTPTERVLEMIEPGRFRATLK